MAEDEIYVRLKADVEDLKKKMVEVQNSMKGTANDFKTSAKGMGESQKAAGAEIEASAKASAEALKEQQTEIKQAAIEAKEAATVEKMAAMQKMQYAQAANALGRQMSELGGEFGNGKKIVGEWGEKAKAAFQSIPAPVRDTISTAMVLTGQITAMISTFAQLNLLMKSVNLTQAAMTVKNAALGTSTGGVTVAQWLYNASLYGCPLVWIIAAIVALIAVIALLILNWDAVSKAVGDFGKWAGDGLGKAGEAVNNWAADTKKSLENAWNGFSKWCGDVGAAGAKAWKGLQDGAKAAWDWISGGFKGMADQAVAWGKGLIESFKKGMDSARKWLEDGCKSIGDSIKNFLGIHSPAKEGPLRELMDWGPNLVKSYASGIRSELPTLTSAVSQMSGQAALGAPSTTSTYNLNAAFNITGTGGAVNFEDPLMQSLLADIVGREIARKLKVT